MPNQPLTAYRQAAELMMQLQQETLRFWVDFTFSPWLIATRAADGRGLIRPDRTMPEQRLRNGEALEARNRLARAAAIAKSPLAAESAKVQLHEEELKAHKKFVETGQVRVRKEVVSELRTIEVPVQREEMIIERCTPTGEHVGDIRIPIREEQISVEKHTVAKEEVEVSKRTVQDTELVSGEVHREVIRIEREGDVEIHEIGKE